MCVLVILSALVDFFFFLTGPEGVILGAGGTAELALSSSAKGSAVLRSYGETTTPCNGNDV
jgi:hypothetical protein